MPIAVAGHQAGSANNGHYGGRVYYPLIASIAETGDLVGARLREGRAHPAAEAPGWIPELVDQASHQRRGCCCICSPMGRCACR